MNKLHFLKKKGRWRSIQWEKHGCISYF